MTVSQYSGRCGGTGSAGGGQAVGVLEGGALLVLAHVERHLDRLADDARLVSAVLGQQLETLRRADGAQRLGTLVTHLPEEGGGGASEEAIRREGEAMGGGGKSWREMFNESITRGVQNN